MATLLGSCEENTPIPAAPKGTGKIAFTQSSVVSINSYQSATVTTSIPVNTYGIEVDEYGHCWATVPNPDINNSSSADNESSTTFTNEIDNLELDTKYYIRAYLKFGSAVVYGRPQTLTITNSNPIASGTVDKNNGEVGVTSFTFDASNSSDPEDFNTPGSGLNLESKWDFNGDGIYDSEWSSNPIESHVFLEEGNYKPIVLVRDDGGKIDSYILEENLGVFDPQNNPVTISGFTFPKYSIVNQEIESRVEAVDRNARLLTYMVNYDGNADVTGNPQTYTYSDVGKRTIEVTVTNDYNVTATITKQVDVGSEINGPMTLTDNADGRKYKAKEMDDGSIWLIQNFARKVGEASWYDNDSLNNRPFGRYYLADEIDGLGTIVLTEDDGTAHNFEVANAADWEALLNQYGNSAALKYKEFSNGENNGATNASGFSLMLGGRNGGYFTGIENYGYYITSTDDSGERKFSYVTKDNTELQILGYTDNRRAPVRLIERN